MHARELTADRGLFVVGIHAGEDEVVVGNRRLTRKDGVAAGDLVEGVNRERRGPVRRRQQVGVDAKRHPRRDILRRDRLVDPVRKQDLLRRGHPAGAGFVGPVDHRDGANRSRELAPADREDPAAAADLFFLGRERDRRVSSALRLVAQLTRHRIERERIVVSRVLHGFRALHDMEPEIEAVAAEDVPHVPAADDDQLEPRFFGDTLEAGGTHLARRANRKAVAGDHEVLAAMDPRPEIRHQVPKRTGLPALVERLEALGDAVRRRSDLIGIDRVQLLATRRLFGVPENQRLAADERRGNRGSAGPAVGFNRIVYRGARLEACRLDFVHDNSC